MNYANPILICDENEEFRILIRDMLTRNGFFHILEASDKCEAIEYLIENEDFFVLVDAKLLGEELMHHLRKQKEFIIFANKAEANTATLAAKLGVERILSYPVHSRKLMEKLNTFF